MSVNAIKFTNNRKKLALTHKRVKEILVCVINSYKKIISDGIIFNFSERGKIPQEDFLRNRFVDDYLKHECELSNSGTDNYTIIAKDGQEEYNSEIDQENHNDKIDIQIFDKSLRNSLTSNEDVYFSIECKRLKSSLKDYISDIYKFCTRKYRKGRLPFEGQLGFVENGNFVPSGLSQALNKELANSCHIKTLKQLEYIELTTNFDASYYSEHQKNDTSPFSIFHLFLDYSKIVNN